MPDNKFYPDNEFHRRLIELGWEPPKSMIDCWLPPKGTFLREIWLEPLGKIPEIRERWNKEHAHNPKS